MTDRHAAYIVTLAEDIREDDAEVLVVALGAIRGVLSVKPVVSDVELWIAEERARNDLGSRVLDAIYRRDKGGAA
jgi:hypothetical protein